jgi:hypothetical protein
MSVIVYTNPETGNLHVIHPNPDLPLADVLAKDVPQDAQQVEIVDVLPGDRKFRGAWQKVGGQVSVDMVKARGIHMDRIRTSRNKELDRLDKEYLRADEDGSPQEKAQIANQKRALRTLPETFSLESCLTPEELDAAWPADLPRNGV